MIKKSISLSIYNYYYKLLFIYGISIIFLIFKLKDFKQLFKKIMVQQHFLIMMMNLILVLRNIFFILHFYNQLIKVYIFFFLLKFFLDFLKILINFYLFLFLFINLYFFIKIILIFIFKFFNFMINQNIL